MRDPDFIGVGDWRAWNCRVQNTEPQHTQLAGWLLHCRGAHPMWSYWWLSLIHLRDIPGAPPAKLAIPGASHELISFAQDPGQAPDPDDVKTFRHLTPIDWAIQFKVGSDRDAVRLGVGVVNLTMSGAASPDTDYRTFWAQAIRETAEHFVAGRHPEN
jgi:hypothetical protein